MYTIIQKIKLSTGDVKMREVLMNEKTNLLQLEEHFYQLVDVDEPNTFRNLFPYSEVPKIAFNDRIVPTHRNRILRMP